MIPEKLYAQTRARFEGRAKEQQALRERALAGATPLTLDAPERVRKYLLRRGLSEVAEALPNLTPTKAAPAAETARLPQTERLLYERVLGTSQLMAVRFLDRGARLARAVGRVRLRDLGGGTVGYGTGTLVSPQLLLTNNHVLPTADEARTSWVEFGYEESAPGRLLPPVPFELEPDRFFVTSEELDFSVVAVRASAVDGTPLAGFGFAHLAEEEGKVLLGQTLNIIQHPNGEPKQVALRENDLVDLLPDFLHYHTDTAPGSSGSLVCSDEWEVVALHHSGVPEEHPGGGYLAVDGSPWVTSMGEHRLKWKANEGVRVSRILKDLKARALTPNERALADEIFSPPAYGDRSRDPERAVPGGAPVAPGPVSPPGQPTAIQISISVPLAGGGPLPVTVTGPGAAPVRGVMKSGNGWPDASDLDQALAALAEAKKVPYYGAKQDETDAEAYYAEIDATAGPEALYRALHDLLAETHTTELKYAPLKQVYPWVDLYPDLKLRSIYSGQEFEPEQVIREDFRILQERLARAEATLRTREGTFTEAQLLREVDLLEATLPYNCEHVVPQSWFGKKEPMRGDLHHLFSCESGCNSFRGNTPYFDFADFEEAVRDECGKREANKFEPGAGKGAVARATLYFLLRYPGEIDDRSTEYTRDRLEILLGWHENDPVGKWERHRNAVIFRKQGNRNPLIDHPEWAAKIAFEEGLG